jgi:hypothetical protein
MSIHLTWQPPNPDKASDRPMGANPYRVRKWTIGTNPNSSREQPMRNGPVARLSGIQVAERETQHSSRHDRKGAAPLHMPHYSGPPPIKGRMERGVTQMCPSLGNPLSPGPSPSLARRAVSLFKSHIETSLHPQDFPFYLPFFYQGIGLRDIMKLMSTVLMSTKTPKPEGSKSQLLRSYRGFPYRRIGAYDVVVRLHHNSSNPELQWHVCYSFATSPPLSTLSGIAGSQFRWSKYRAMRIVECRIPTFRDLVPPVPMIIDGSD